MTAAQLITELQSRIDCGCINPKDRINLYIPDPDSEKPIMQCPLLHLWCSDEGVMLVGESDSE